MGKTRYSGPRTWAYLVRSRGKAGTIASRLLHGDTRRPGRWCSYGFRGTKGQCLCHRILGARWVRFATSTAAPMSRQEAIGEVMQTFGISRTAAQLPRVQCPLQGRIVCQQWTAATRPVGVEWLIAEDFTLDYFPVASVPSTTQRKICRACG